MQYTGEETIRFPQFEEMPPVEKRIEEWLHSAVGANYEIKKWNSEEIVLEKSWNESSCLEYYCFGFWVFFMGERIRMTIQPGKSEVYLTVESTKKQQAELEFDSLIKAIGDPGATTENVPVDNWGL
ncbi:MAG: hypothetical protein R6V83_01025 [Candidatus Thorarchaeota archaeon]